MKGIIYKIEINENNIYVGSTTQKLCRRQVNHNCDLKTQPQRKLYKSCIENNIKYIKCIWIADIEYDSIAELRMIEENYRKKLIANLNSQRCYTTEEDKKEYQKEYRKQNKIELNEKRKEYRKQNKEKINENNKEYYQENKIEITEKRKEYRKQNKEKINEKKKEYYEKNKDKKKEYYEKNKIELNKKNKEKIKCDKCNCLISKSNISTHKKSMKCLLLSECLFSDSEDD